MKVIDGPEKLFVTGEISEWDRAVRVNERIFSVAGIQSEYWPLLDCHMLPGGSRLSALTPKKSVDILGHVSYIAAKSSNIMVVGPPETKKVSRISEELVVEAANNPKIENIYYLGKVAYLGKKLEDVAKFGIVNDPLELFEIDEEGDR